MRKILGALGLLAGSLLVCAVLLEMATLALFGEQVKFPRRVVGAPFGVRINQPNATYRHESADVSVQFRINGKGLRADREYSYEKPPRVRRIIAQRKDMAPFVSLMQAGKFGITALTATPEQRWKILRRIGDSFGPIEVTAFVIPELADVLMLRRK